MRILVFTLFFGYALTGWGQNLWKDFDLEAEFGVNFYTPSPDQPFFGEVNPYPAGSVAAYLKYKPSQFPIYARLTTIGLNLSDGMQFRIVAKPFGQTEKKLRSEPFIDLYRIEIGGHYKWMELGINFGQSGKIYPLRDGPFALFKPSQERFTSVGARVKCRIGKNGIYAMGHYQKQISGSIKNINYIDADGEFQNQDLQYAGFGIGVGYRIFKSIKETDYEIPGL